LNSLKKQSPESKTSESLTSILAPLTFEPSALSLCCLGNLLYAVKSSSAPVVGGIAQIFFNP
jgi:hypothetical protein